MKKDKNKEMKDIDKLITVILILIVCSLLVLVFLFGKERGYVKGYNKGYIEGENYTKRIDGLRLGGNYTKKEAIEEARRWDEFGDWVCVNIREMDYGRAVEVCQHEAGHEIFAEILEKNPEKIDEVMKVIEK